MTLKNRSFKSPSQQRKSSFSRIIYCLILAEFQSCVGLWKRDETYFLIPAFDRSDLVRTMPVRSITNEMDVVPALAPIKSKQPGVTNSLLYSGSRFVGHQKSKGNQYDVEVILQVRNKLFIALRKSKIYQGIVNLCLIKTVQFNNEFLRHHFCNFTSTSRYIYTTYVFTFLLLQYVNLEECYLCGYLKIKGLTEEYPTLTTFFDGEIISKKYPFLTRKWEADEDVDKKHWVRIS